MSSPQEEFRCFVGGLSWSTTDRGLEEAFRPYSSVIEAKVIVDRDTGRSRGFGFVTFGDERSMDEAIDRLHGKDLDGRSITVNRAQQKSKGEGGDRYSGGGGRSGGRGGSGGGGGGDNCFKCGQPGHWARECTGGGGGGGGGGRYSRDRNGSRSDRSGGGDRHGGSRYSSSDRYGGGERSGSDRYSNGEGRSGGSTRDRESGRSDRYGGGGAARSERSDRDRSGPYDRPSGNRSSYDDRH